jgi:hypothetical protein
MTTTSPPPTITLAVPKPILNTYSSSFNNISDTTNNDYDDDYYYLTWQQLQQLEDNIGIDAVKKQILSNNNNIKLKFPSQPQPINIKHEERMKYLRARQEQREYTKMMAGAARPGTIPFLTPKSVAPEHTGADHNGFRQSLVALNMVIAAGAAFIAAFYMAGTLGMSPVSKTVIGMFALVGMLFVEMILFIIRASKFEAIDERQRQRANRSFNGFAPAGRTREQLSEAEQQFLNLLEQQQQQQQLNNGTSNDDDDDDDVPLIMNLTDDNNNLTIKKQQ